MTPSPSWLTVRVGASSVGTFLLLQICRRQFFGAGGAIIQKKNKEKEKGKGKEERREKRKKESLNFLV